jgi:3-oxoadipate enol-lactonase
MPYAIHNGCRLMYRVDGDPEAPPVLFSNSLGTTHELWMPQVAAFSRTFRVIRYDTRGHGGSDSPPGEYTIEDLGSDALAVLDAAGAGRADMCGLSLGGLTAMWLALHAPERIGSLVLASTGAKIGTAELWQERIDQVTASGVASLAKAAAGRWFTEPFRVANSTVVFHQWEMLRSCPPEGYAGCCAVLRDTDLRGEIGRITAPVLVVAGVHDPVTPPSDAEEIRARLPHARITLLEASHIANIEQADVFNERVLTFITKHGRIHG